MKIRRLAFHFLSQSEPLIDLESFSLSWTGLGSLQAPSGAGKTTFFRLICGWNFGDNSDGSVVRDFDFDCHSHVRFVGGHKGLLPWLRVESHISLYCPERAKEIHAASQSIGLDVSVFKLYPYQLSVGMYKRVELLLAVAAKPKLLLLDEFFTSLGDDNKRAIREHITREMPESAVWVIAHEESVLHWIGGPRYTFRMEGSTVREIVPA